MMTPAKVASARRDPVTDEHATYGRLGSFMKNNWQMVVFVAGIVATAAVMQRDTADNTRKIEGLASKDDLRRVEAKLDWLIQREVDRPK